MRPGYPPRRTTPANPAAASAIWHGGHRLLLFLSGGAAAVLVIQVLRVLTEATGMCTGCNVGSDGDMLWAAAVGGGAAAAGGSDDLFGADYFDGLFDRILGREPLEPSIEGQPLPVDPAFDGPADVDAIRNSGFYQEVVSDDGTLSQLSRAARRLLGSDVREPAPAAPLPDPPLPNEPHQDRPGR